MSDHDHHEKEESKNPLASLVGTIFLILVPFALIVMFGFVGVALIQGAGYKTPPPANTMAVAKPAAAAKSGDPAAAPSAAPTEEQMALGKTAFMTCAACHGMDGKGMQVGPHKMAPSFEASELLLGNPEASIAAVLKGIVKGPTSPYLGQMMALGAGMDDTGIAAVLTFARNSFGNSASAITPEQVAEMRTKYAAADAPMGLPREDLEKVAKGE